jgi:hypothetical protein
VGVPEEELAAYEKDEHENRRKVPIHGANYYPLDITVLKTSALLGPRSAGCFNAQISVEHDCTEAKTCGCQSAVLSVVVAGELQVLESRLDEISDVFQADHIQLNLTLCDLSRLLGTSKTASAGDAGAAMHNVEAGYHFVPVEATLRHGSSKELMAVFCRNVSRTGEAKECKGTRALGRTRKNSNSKGTETTSTSGAATTVKVQGVVFKSEEAGECRSGACGRALPSLQSAREAYKAGKWDEALDALTRVATYGEGSDAAQDGGGGSRRRAALERMALLPPFALSGKCCDSVNPHCKGIDVAEMYASEAYWERKVLNLRSTKALLRLY